MENEKLYNESIILIGPSGAGKTTVADELSIMTKLPRLCLDEIANSDREAGAMDRFRNADEYNAFLIETQLERAKRQEKPGIVDFGAGHSVYDDVEIFNGVKKQVGRFKNVVLLLPTHDLEKSLEILASRSTGDFTTNRKFITSHCNEELATIIIYEDGRTPRQIAEEIIRTINISRSKDNREER